MTLLRSLWLPAVLGGLGGAINAFLCYVQQPVPIPHSAGVFKWPIVPAGALHGALLALVSVGMARLLSPRKPLAQWFALPITGYLAGLVSWFPLNVSLNFGWGLYREWSVQTLWWPYVYFGLVGLCYYFCLVLGGRLIDTRLSMHIAIGVLSGVLGSLWWWVSWHPWYFSLLHGSIWGTCVGFGLWRSQTNIQRALLTTPL